MSSTQSNDPDDTPLNSPGMADIPPATPASPPSALPRPAVSASNAQLKFVPAEDGEAHAFEPLPPEIANADISIAREFISSYSCLRVDRLLGMPSMAGVWEYGHAR